MSDEVGDRVASGMLDKAQACLDHVRKVWFGEAQANYQTDDGALRLAINITVRSLGRVDKHE